MDPTAAPNLSYLIASRLGEDWSAERFQVKPELLAQLTEDSFASLDPFVKSRLILSCLMTASRQQMRGSGAAPVAAADGGGAGGTQLAAQLKRLGELAMRDDDAWVKVLGASAGDFDGRLDMEALCAANPKVRSSVEHLKVVAEGCGNAELLPPLESLYLSPSGRGKGAAPPPSALARQHFSIRLPGEVPAVRPRPRVPRPEPLSPASGSGQGSLLARRGTSTGEDSAFRPSRLAQRAQPAHRQAQERPAARLAPPLEPGDAEEPGPRAAAKPAGAAGAGAPKLGWAAMLAQQQRLAGIAPKVRPPVQVKMKRQPAAPGAGQQQQQQEQEQQRRRRPARRGAGGAEDAEEEEDADATEEEEGGGPQIGVSLANRLAAWKDDDDSGGEDEDPLERMRAREQERARAREASEPQIARRGRLASGRLQRAASGGAEEDLSGGGALEDGGGLEDMEEDVREGAGAAGGQQQLNQQLRDLFEDEDDEAEDGRAGAAPAEAGGAVGAAAAAAGATAAADAPGGAAAAEGAEGMPGAKSKRRRAVISDDEDD